MSHWISEQEIMEQIKYHEEEAAKAPAESELRRVHTDTAEIFREELRKLRQENCIDVKTSEKDS